MKCFALGDVAGREHDREVESWFTLRPNVGDVGISGFLDNVCSCKAVQGKGTLRGC